MLSRIVEFTLLAARLVLIGVFLLAGATKLVDPLGLRKALRDFGVAPGLARPAIVLLPVLELAVAAALIPTGLAWYGACGAFALLAVFCIVAGIAMLRGRRPKCHCFGQLHSAPVGWRIFIRNGVLAACAGWVISRGHLHSGPSLWAWIASLDSVARRMAIIAGCAAGFGFLYLLDRARHDSDAGELQPLAATAPVADKDDKEVREQRPVPVRRRRPPPARRRPPPPAAAIRGTGVGLPVGTPAPDFELPAITGDRHSLQSLREGGTDVLLLFSSPFCDACLLLTSNFLRWMREMPGLPPVVLISRGTAQDNLAKLRGFEPGRVLLQRDLEVSDAYDCTTTPAAVLVGADGLIRSDLALGAVAIEQLLSSCAVRGNSEKPGLGSPDGLPRSDSGVLPASVSQPPEA